MRYFLLFLTFFSIQVALGQAFYGRGDVIFQTGANLQNDGAGVNASLDFGLADNLSFGFSSSYLIDVPRTTDSEGHKKPIPGFSDRFDLKARLNANLGSVINISDQVDIYPGLNASLKNFGGHLGIRYFFTYGFGVYSELNVPFAKYKTETLTRAEKLHNQVSINLGLSFGF